MDGGAEDKKEKAEVEETTESENNDDDAEKRPGFFQRIVATFNQRWGCYEIKYYLYRSVDDVAVAVSVASGAGCTYYEIIKLIK